MYICMYVYTVMLMVYRDGFSGTKKEQDVLRVQNSLPPRVRGASPNPNEVQIPTTSLKLPTPKTPTPQTLNFKQRASATKSSLFAQA